MIYWFPLGTYSAIYCPFCLETCKKEEAEQIPGSGIIEDKFWCSNKDEAWHEQIERIKEEYNKTLWKNKVLVLSISGRIPFFNQAENIK